MYFVFFLLNAAAAERAITPALWLREGADIFSYAPDENDMVTDPKLAEHLSHFGINIMQMQKTEKSMAEMQIELNLNFNYGAILEDGVQLVNCYAPGRIGLKNLGNS